MPPARRERFAESRVGSDERGKLRVRAAQEDHTPRLRHWCGGRRSSGHNDCGKRKCESDNVDRDAARRKHSSHESSKGAKVATAPTRKPHEELTKKNRPGWGGLTIDTQSQLVP